LENVSGLLRQEETRWPFVFFNVTAAGTIKPQPYRGAERAAKVSLLKRNWPPLFSANFFFPCFSPKSAAKLMNQTAVVSSASICGAFRFAPGHDEIRARGANRPDDRKGSTFFSGFSPRRSDRFVITEP
jgi:hypothetical protein